MLPEMNQDLLLPSNLHTMMPGTSKLLMLKINTLMQHLTRKLESDTKEIGKQEEMSHKPETQRDGA